MTRRAIRLFLSLLLCSSVAGACGGQQEQEPASDAGGEAKGEELPFECSSDADCDDEIACTEDVCTDGNCRYLPSDDECAGEACREGACNPAVGCEFVAFGDGTPCDSGVCSEGECVECLQDGDCEPDGRDCYVATCENGSCAYSGDDDLCEDDGPDCTSAVCTDEGCERLADDTVCEQSNECSAGSCDLEDGCTTEPLDFGASCTGGACIDAECRDCDATVQLWQNGPLATHGATGADGHDESRLQNDTLDMSTLGFDLGGDRWASEGFRVEEGRWYVESFVVYAYQTGSARESTFETLRYEIRDAPPDDPESSVVHGDLEVDALREGRFSGIYRTSETNGGAEADSRPIMELEADVDTELEPGTYWIVWAIEGSLDSGPWAPPITRVGQATTGNALRAVDEPENWAPLEDGDTGAPQGLPLDVYGHAASCTE